MTRLTKAVRDELRARYIAKQAADERLMSYLLGVLHQVGVTPEDYAGFDDRTGEVLLRADELPTG